MFDQLVSLCEQKILKVMEHEMNELCLETSGPEKSHGFKQLLHL